MQFPPRLPYQLATGEKGFFIGFSFFARACNRSETWLRIYTSDKFYLSAGRIDDELY